jgi:hypothetical protein
MELYFDVNNGALLSKTPTGEYQIVKTNAQLDPSHIRLDKDGFLYLRNYVDDTEYPMTDRGVMVSLKGPKGDKGDPGI